MTEPMVMPYDSVFQACKAFYNLSTTEVSIIDLLVNKGNYVGDARSLAQRLNISYSQITQALTHLDEAGIILRNTTGNSKIRMRALCLCPHWEYALIKSQSRTSGEIPIKNKRSVAKSWI
jgi:predicted transcriptional regulator